MSELTIKYFKEYRKELGFTNQDNVKKFFAAKDIEFRYNSEIKLNYIKEYYA